VTTFNEILATVRRVQSCSRKELSRQLARLKIQPFPVRPVIRYYPADAALRILFHLGCLDGARKFSPRLVSSDASFPQATPSDSATASRGARRKLHNSKSTT